MVGAQDIDARDAQAHDLGRTDGGHAFFRGDLDQAGGAAAVQVGAELAGLGLTLHGGDHLFTHHEAADIRAARFLDVFLHHDVLLEAHEGLDHRFGGGGGFAHDHTDTLGAFEYLDHQRGAVDHLDQVGDIVR